MNPAQDSFGLTANSIDATVKDVLEVQASNFAFDLSRGDNYAVTVGSATVSMPRLKGLGGTITGLSLDNSGMTIQQATLTLPSIGGNSATFDGSGPISLVNPSISISNLSYQSGAFAFNGDPSFAADSASLAFGGGSSFRSPARRPSTRSATWPTWAARST